MVEVSTFTRSIRVVQAYLGVRNCLAADPCHIELEQETQDEVVKVQEPIKAFQLIERLEIPELCYEERLDIASQFRELFGAVQEPEPAMVFA